jgi:hypothetical protein
MPFVSFNNAFIYLVRFQTMMVLSREADKTISGASEVVAMAVTLSVIVIKNKRLHVNNGLF